MLSLHPVVAILGVIVDEPRSSLLKYWHGR